jgi:hypothetical protein
MASSAGTVAGIFILVTMIVSVIAVAVVFIWAARKDGEDDRDLQRRLGIKRRTRLGK